MTARTLVLGALLLVVACSEGSQTVSVTDVVSHIPWSPPETAHYQLFRDDKPKGTADLTLGYRGDTLIMSQSFDIPDQKVTDHAEVEVNRDTLRPTVARRVIDGTEGKRECEAKYSSASVVVEQHSGKDQRTDTQALPDKIYDTWGDLFLWRTLNFSAGLEFQYLDMLSCSLGKPELLTVVLNVKGLETIRVPKGEFETWHMEIRSGGRTQQAWYANSPDHSLVRYDNGELVFELE